MHAVRYGQQLGRLLGCINHPDDLLKFPTTEGNQELIKTARALPIGNAKEVQNLIKQIKQSDGISSQYQSANAKSTELSTDQLAFNL